MLYAIPSSSSPNTVNETARRDTVATEMNTGPINNHVYMFTLFIPSAN